MWVYTGTQNAQGAAAQPLLPEASQAKNEQAPPQHTPESPAKSLQSAKSAVRAKPRHAAGQATKNCILLAASYLLGTMAAGALQALCDTAEQEVLQYYLGRWCALFTLGGTRSVAVLFCTEYFTAAVIGTLLLLFGLSALGPVPIFLFTMLYGTGIGLLAAQLFSGITAKTFAAYLLVAGVPAAAAAGCVCMFGAAALEVCTKLQAFSFGRRTAAQSAGARGLLGQYALFMAALLPLSGAATGLVYMANSLHLW